MSKQQILEKAIQKAIEGGWNAGDSHEISLAVRQPDKFQGIFDGTLYDIRHKGGEFDGIPLEYFDWHINEFIFNHDFARALWGERAPVSGMYDLYHDQHPNYDPNLSTTPAWQHHLQQMVVDPDPIQYLADHMDD